MASKVELELQKATGIKPQAKEKPQDYLKRLHGAVSDLDDEAWKGLSTPAQKWANDATKAFDNDKPLPEFEAAEEEAPAKAPAKKAVAKDEEEDDASAADAEDETDADEPEGEGESEDKKVSTKTKTKAAAKPAAKAPAKKAAAKDEAPAKKKAAPGKSAGGVQAVLNHVLKNPDDSVADIVAALKKDGITVTTSTVSSARGFFKLVVRFLQNKKLTTKVIFKD